MTPDVELTEITDPKGIPLSNHQLFMFKPAIIKTFNHPGAQPCEVCELELIDHEWIILDLDKVGIVFECSNEYSTYAGSNDDLGRIDAKKLFAQFYSYVLGERDESLWEFSYVATDPRIILVALKPQYHYLDPVPSNLYDYWYPERV